MKLITELNDNIEILTELDESSSEKKFYIHGIFMQAEQKNRNGRVYPKEILEKEVNRYIKDHIEKRRAYGELGHPSGPTINLDRVSHMITELKSDDNNFIGKAKIMDTPNGKIVKELMKEGASLGVSSRGMGSLKPHNGMNEVQKDFYLATPADIVADPSAPEAFVNGIMEDVDWIYDDKRGWIAEKMKEEIDESVRKGELNEKKRMELLERFIKSI